VNPSSQRHGREENELEYIHGQWQPENGDGSDGLKEAGVCASAADKGVKAVGEVGEGITPDDDAYNGEIDGRAGREPEATQLVNSDW
jgi:hypothetical protein